MVPAKVSQRTKEFLTGIARKKYVPIKRCRNRSSSVMKANHRKYPSAEPEALRLLAPQRGLTAIGQNQNRTVIAQSVVSVFVAVIPASPPAKPVGYLKE